MKVEPLPARVSITTNGALVRIRTAAGAPEYLSAYLVLSRAEARELVGKLEDVLVTGEAADMEVSP